MPQVGLLLLCAEKQIFTTKHLWSNINRTMTGLSNLTVSLKPSSRSSSLPNEMLRFQYYKQSIVTRYSPGTIRHVLQPSEGFWSMSSSFQDTWQEKAWCCHIIVIEWDRLNTWRRDIESLWINLLRCLEILCADTHQVLLPASTPCPNCPLMNLISYTTLHDEVADQQDTRTDKRASRCI